MLSNDMNSTLNKMISIDIVTMKETQDYFMKVDDDMYDNLSSYATRERCYVGLSHSDICL